MGSTTSSSHPHLVQVFWERTRRRTNDQVTNYPIIPVYATKCQVIIDDNSNKWDGNTYSYPAVVA